MSRLSVLVVVVFVFAKAFASDCYDGLLSLDQQGQRLRITSDESKTIWQSNYRAVIGAHVDQATSSVLFLTNATTDAPNTLVLSQYRLSDGSLIKNYTFSSVPSISKALLDRQNILCATDNAVYIYIGNATLLAFYQQQTSLVSLSLPDFVDRNSNVFMACSTNRLFISLPSRNQVWIANDHNLMLEKTPLFVPSSNVLYFEPQNNILYVASGSDLLREIYAFDASTLQLRATYPIELNSALRSFVVSGFLFTEFYTVEVDNTVRVHGYRVSENDQGSEVIDFFNADNLFSDATGQVLATTKSTIRWLHQTLSLASAVTNNGNMQQILIAQMQEDNNTLVAIDNTHMVNRYYVGENSITLFDQRTFAFEQEITLLSLSDDGSKLLWFDAQKLIVFVSDLLDSHFFVESQPIKQGQQALAGSIDNDGRWCVLFGDAVECSFGKAALPTGEHCLFVAIDHWNSRVFVACTDTVYYDSISAFAATNNTVQWTRLVSLSAGAFRVVTGDTLFFSVRDNDQDRVLIHLTDNTNPHLVWLNSTVGAIDVLHGAGDETFCPFGKQDAKENSYDQVLLSRWLTVSIMGIVLFTCIAICSTLCLCGYKTTLSHFCAKQISQKYVKLQRTQTSTADTIKVDPVPNRYMGIRICSFHCLSCIPSLRERVELWFQRRMFSSTTPNRSEDSDALLANNVVPRTDGEETAPPSSSSMAAAAAAASSSSGRLTDNVVMSDVSLSNVDGKKTV